MLKSVLNSPGETMAAKAKSKQWRLLLSLACAPMVVALISPSAFSQEAGNVAAPEPAVIERLQAEYAGDEHPVCLVSAVGEEGQANMLVAGCNGQGVLLGAADRYEAVTHVESGTTLVVATQALEVRVLMLSLDAAGNPLLEDLTTTLSEIAGRGPRSRLRDIRVDLNRFRATGVIDLIPEPSKGGRVGQQASFDVRPLRDAERARSGTAAPAANAGGES